MHIYLAFRIASTIEYLIIPILLCSIASTWDLEEAIRTVVRADLDRHTFVATYCIAFFTEEEGIQRVKAARRRGEMGRRRGCKGIEAWTMIQHAGSHLQLPGVGFQTLPSFADALFGNGNNCSQTNHTSSRDLNLAKTLETRRRSLSLVLKR